MIKTKEGITLKPIPIIQGNGYMAGDDGIIYSNKGLKGDEWPGF